MPVEYKIILFSLATVGLAWVSRASLRRIRSHGFCRFFAWETLLILFLMNMEAWFADPFSYRQMLSWLCLILSLVFIYLGVQAFRHQGKIDPARRDPALVGIEKTTTLVTNGVYHYIRHPFYSSLLFLGCGIFLKQVSWLGGLLAAVNTVLLLVTARIEERENADYFGAAYRDYMQHTKMFVPYLF